MSNVISFLERMGQNAQLRCAIEKELEVALVKEGVTPELQDAILAGDSAQLELLLGGSPLCCLMFPVKEGEDDIEESPSKGDEEVSLCLVSRAVASVG